MISSFHLTVLNQISLLDDQTVNLDSLLGSILNLMIRCVSDTLIKDMVFNTE